MKNDIPVFVVALMIFVYTAFIYKEVKSINDNLKVLVALEIDKVK